MLDQVELSQFVVVHYKSQNFSLADLVYKEPIFMNIASPAAEGIGTEESTMMMKMHRMMMKKMMKERMGYCSLEHKKKLRVNRYRSWD